jgi:hypothetical protein
MKMNRGTKLVFTLGLALAGLLAAPQTARANTLTGYVCNVDEGWSPGAYGNFGFVSAAIYSGLGCTGTHLGDANFATTGSTICQSDLLSESRLAHISENLVLAASQGLKVHAFVTTPAGGSCAYYLYIYGK